MESPSLQSLVVTADWRVGYHQFFALDPTPQLVTDTNGCWFKEDMYQALNERRARLIDLGWYPEGNFESGAFRLVLYQGDFHGELLREIRSQDRSEIVIAMNEWFALVSDGGL